MAQFNLFNSFTLDLASGVHDLTSDTIMIALMTEANAPTGAESLLAGLTPIAYTNLSSREVTITSAGAVTTNDFKLVLADLVLTASGGSVATFRRVAVYNDTVANKPLIGHLDLGENITLADTYTAKIRFADDAATDGTLSIKATTP